MSITMLLDMASGSCGERLALGSRHGDGLTYADLSRIAAGGATMINDSGARRVAFVGINSPAFPALLLASAHAGVPITPLNYRLSPTQLGELVVALGSPYLVADRELLHLIDVAATATLISTQDWLARARESVPAPPAEVDADDPAVMLFTSGTTSKPKGVVLRHSNLVSYVLQTVEFLGAEEEDCALVSVPPYHIAGVGTVLTNLYSGRRLCYLPNFAADAWLRAVKAEHVTHAMVVPTMLVRIIEHLDGQPAGVPHLRALAYGGARMPRSSLEKALVAFPEAGFVNAYGLTETSSTIAVLGPDDHRVALESDDPLVQARLGSAGRPVPGIEAVIRTPQGQEAASGEPGELWVRGPQVSGEYDGLGSSLDADGWFPTKDLAYVDQDGYLFILGRSDDTIIRGGENIAPAEIEDVLCQHPSVRDVAVFGAEDDEWGERVIAAVVLVEGHAAEGEELRAWVRTRLRGSRTPDVVFFREELPYTQTGKLLRRQLAQDVLQASSTA